MILGPYMRALPFDQNYLSLLNFMKNICILRLAIDLKKLGS